MKRDCNRVFDEYLVTSAIAGDRAAWHRLVLRWQPRLLRHAWRLLSHAERAQDAVQESWLEIVRGLAQLDDSAAFPAWALQIVTRRCQRLYARRDRDRCLVSDSELDGYAGTEGVGAIESHADTDQLQSALARLPSAQRSAIALFYLEDLSVAEIAVALDVPPGTVKTRLMHARHKLRVLLEGESHGQI